MTPEQASTSIDHFLHTILNTGEGDVGGSVHIHCTDVAGEWTIRESDAGLSVSREHAKGDCAIRGAALDILAVLSRQAPLSTVDVVGDAEVAARFVDASTLF
jgi:predicted lipid carrier protein YhbT